MTSTQDGNTAAATLGPVLIPVTVTVPAFLLLLKRCPSAILVLFWHFYDTVTEFIMHLACVVY